MPLECKVQSCNAKIKFHILFQADLKTNAWIELDNVSGYRDEPMRENENRFFLALKPSNFAKSATIKSEKQKKKVKFSNTRKNQPLICKHVEIKGNLN